MRIAVVYLWSLVFLPVILETGEDSVFSRLYENSGQYHYAHDSIAHERAEDTLREAVPFDAGSTADASKVQQIGCLNENKVVHLTTAGKVISALFLVAAAWFLAKLVIRKL